MTACKKINSKEKEKTLTYAKVEQGLLEVCKPLRAKDPAVNFKTNQGIFQVNNADSQG